MLSWWITLLRMIFLFEKTCVSNTHLDNETCVSVNTAAFEGSWGQTVFSQKIQTLNGVVKLNGVRKSLGF